MQGRNKKGQFGRKSDSDRQVRSIRVTDEVWQNFGNMASERGITRADLLEKIVNSRLNCRDDSTALSLLEDALKLKANAGGAIKKKIKEAIKILF